MKEAAESLDAIRSERLDTYTVIGRKDGRTLTLLHRDGREFRDVIFPAPVSENVQSRPLAAQLVTYNDKTYINGSAVWLNKEALPVWNGWKPIGATSLKKNRMRQSSHFSPPRLASGSVFTKTSTPYRKTRRSLLRDMGINFDSLTFSISGMHEARELRMKNEE